MAHFYTLQSCDPLSYPDISNLSYTNANHPFTNKIVEIAATSYPILADNGDYTYYLIPPNQTYTLLYLGQDITVFSLWLPRLLFTNLDTCADAIADRMYKVESCLDGSTRDVLLPITYAIDTVLVFTGECECYKVIENIASYDESLTVDSSYVDCTTCLTAVDTGLCEYGERALSYAVGIAFPKTEPVSRGYKECCDVGLVFGDLSDTDPYKNDFTSIFYKRQTPADTVSYEIIGQSTGTTALVDGTHGVLYAFGGAEQPDLSYFKVEWRKILSTIGEDVFTIRKVLNIAGQAFNVDSLINYNLKSFTQTLADNTIRIDCKLDGKLVKIDTDFKNTDYENSMRVSGFFGNQSPNWEQDTVVFSSKKGLPYYNDQITMSNDREYVCDIYQIAECQSRTLFDEILWGNDIYVSDYNLNNHSYLYELTHVELAEQAPPNYPIDNRKVDMSITFRDKTKDNRKTNC